MSSLVLALRELRVKIGSNVILEDINLVTSPGEQWAIVGGSGSGKTVLAHTLAGRHFHSGGLHYFFGQQPAQPRISVVDQQHRFKNISNTSDLYYQQRFNASDADQTITVVQELEGYIPMEKIYDLPYLDMLHVRPLLEKPLIQLSNGENKRVQLVIALLTQPDLLILDHPFTGLDSEGRESIQGIMWQLIQHGVAILLITSMHEIPGSITHVACLEKGKLVFTGKRTDFDPQQFSSKENSFSLQMLQQLKQERVEDFEVAVKLNNIHIRYGENIILENLSWEVKRGERWSVSGPNGSGKSTLLSLITADNPQAYANEICLFGRRRGTGESIWDIKKRIGFVSPELHLYFDYQATCFEVLASGFFDTIGLFRMLSKQQEERVLLWLSLLGLENFRSRPLTQLSAGQQRLALLGRALIKNPPLLILDEPCQGLDDDQATQFIKLIDLVCEEFGTTLIYVSHYKHQIPASVRFFLELHKPD